MSQVKQMRQKANLTEQGCPLEYKVKKEGVFPMKQGQVTWEENKDGAC